jgi:GTP-binding protein
VSAAEAPSLTPASPFTPADIEAGRKLFAREWRFACAAGSLAALPPMRGIEIAFAGRSNVGKSSLINALAGRHALARTSRTPGRTQELIFFVSASQLALVDMPGYGYAATSKAKVAAWTALIHAFLRGRANLARVYLLVDARHGLKPVDDDVLATLDKAAVNYQVVLTKALPPVSPRPRRLWPNTPQPIPTCSRPRYARAPAFPNCDPPSPACSRSARRADRLAPQEKRRRLRPSLKASFAWAAGSLKGAAIPAASRKIAR